MCGVYTIVVVRMLCCKYNQVLCMHLSYSGMWGIHCVGYILVNNQHRYTGCHAVILRCLVFKVISSH